MNDDYDDNDGTDGNDDDDLFWFIYDSLRVWAWMKCGLPSES